MFRIVLHHKNLLGTRFVTQAMCINMLLPIGLLEPAAQLAISSLHNMCVVFILSIMINMVHNSWNYCIHHNSLLPRAVHSSFVCRIVRQ